MVGTSWWCKDFEKDGDYTEYSSRVQAVCDRFGPTDFVARAFNNRENGIDDSDSLSAQFMGGPILDNREEAERANPCGYVSENTPPFIIVHGENDDRVPINQSDLLLRRFNGKTSKRSFTESKVWGTQQLNSIIA